MPEFPGFFPGSLQSCCILKQSLGKIKAKERQKLLENSTGIEDCFIDSFSVFLNNKFLLILLSAWMYSNFLGILGFVSVVIDTLLSSFSVISCSLSSSELISIWPIGLKISLKVLLKRCSDLSSSSLESLKHDDKILLKKQCLLRYSICLEYRQC